jgi:hypothetical protein
MPVSRFAIESFGDLDGGHFCTSIEVFARRNRLERTILAELPRCDFT